jgi:hypothetical protein
MAHAQKPDFVFRRNGRDHLNQWGASVQSTAGSRGVRINDINAGYTMFRGSVKSIGYKLHSPVSPSLLLPCVTVCHHISTGFYPIQQPNKLYGVASSQCKPSPLSGVFRRPDQRHANVRYVNKQKPELVGYLVKTQC